MRYQSIKCYARLLHIGTRQDKKMMDYLKDLLPGFYKQYPIPTIFCIFVFFNLMAIVVSWGVRHAVLEAKPESSTQIQINGSIKSGNCSAAGIGQANGVSIQCDDKAAAQPGQEKSGKKK